MRKNRKSLPHCAKASYCCPESINVSITATYKYRFFAAFSCAATPSIRNHNRFNVSTAAIKCMTVYFLLNSILDFDIAAIC
jgi:hypothetical protein